jgi:hypothetical protein
MTWTHSFWLNALIAVTIIGGAEEVLRRLIGKPVARVWIKAERFLDTWNGEPARDGLASRPGLVDRVIAIERQVTNNGGKSLKDTVDRIETASKIAAEMATASAAMATATKSALAEHVEQSAKMIEQGAKDKADIVARQDKQDATIAEQRHTISNLAESLPVVARSTPPEETPNG